MILCYQCTAVYEVNGNTSAHLAITQVSGEEQRNNAFLSVLVKLLLVPYHALHDTSYNYGKIFLEGGWGVGGGGGGTSQRGKSHDNP